MLQSGPLVHAVPPLTLICRGPPLPTFSVSLMWLLPVHSPLAIAGEHTQVLSFLLPLSHFSRVRLCATPQTAAHQAPPCLVFSRQEHWSGLPFPSPLSSLLLLLLSRFSCVWLSATPWTAAHQAPPSMGFPRQEYWSRLPLPSPLSALASLKSILTYSPLRALWLLP